MYFICAQYIATFMPNLMTLAFVLAENNALIRTEMAKKCEVILFKGIYKVLLIIVLRGSPSPKKGNHFPKYLIGC